MIEQRFRSSLGERPEGLPVAYPAVGLILVAIVMGIATHSISENNRRFQTDAHEDSSAVGQLDTDTVSETHVTHSEPGTSEVHSQTLEERLAVEPNACSPVKGEVEVTAVSKKVEPAG